MPLNPRDLRRMMRRLGVGFEELKNVRTVTLTLDDKEIVIHEPQVVVMNIQGQKIYQVIGKREEVVPTSSESVVEEVSFSDEDIRFVMEQTGVGRDEAIRALKEAGGDIAKAILILTSKST